ncbi:MAG TPA: hypothetical protein VN829_21485 [Dongiaceae bacterium]|nr:hypothetical protein [Dongiaceae bacterium]
MKALKTIVLAAMMLATTLAAQAGEVKGYFRSNGTYVAPSSRPSSGSVGRTSSRGYNSGYVYRNPYAAHPLLGERAGVRADPGYVYRNPYAAYPSVNVRGYSRGTGTYVWPHVRTAPNSTVTDNLSYRGYGTIRVPRYSLGR